MVTRKVYLQDCVNIRISSMGKRFVENRNIKLLFYRINMIHLQTNYRLSTAAANPSGISQNSVVQNGNSQNDYHQWGRAPSSQTAYTETRRLPN